MPSSHLECIFLLIWLHNVDDPACVLFLVKTLQHQVTSLWLLIRYKTQVLASRLDHKRVSLFTDLAFKCFPIYRCVVASNLKSLLGVQPIFQAVKVNRTHTAIAITTGNQGIVSCGLKAPTYFALGSLFFPSFRVFFQLMIDEISDLLKLIEFVFIYLFNYSLSLNLLVVNLHRSVDNCDFLDSEL